MAKQKQSAGGKVTKQKEKKNIYIYIYLYTLTQESLAQHEKKSGTFKKEIFFFKLPIEMKNKNGHHAAWALPRHFLFENKRIEILLLTGRAKILKCNATLLYRTSTRGILLLMEGFFLLNELLFIRWTKSFTEKSPTNIRSIWAYREHVIKTVTRVIFSFL